MTAAEIHDAPKSKGHIGIRDTGALPTIEAVTRVLRDPILHTL